MIRSLVLAMSIVVAAPAAAASLSDVQRALAATTTMTASFRQIAQNGSVATGTMTIKRPGRIRFDYGKDAPILIVSDGQRLSFVDYKVSQVSQWPVRQTALGVLIDPDADLSRVARILPDEDSPLPGVVSVEAVDPKRPDLGRITFFLARDRSAPGGLALTGWRVIDAQNNLTQVELSDVRWNVSVADSTFRFRDPRARPGRPGA
ncbi:MAG: outer-membrane lipoprotein carrier protein LolA [Sphingomonadaceae bacterium]